MTAVPIDRVVDEAKVSAIHKRVIALCGILMMVDGYDLISYGSVVGRLMKDWHMSSVQAGWLGSVALVGMLIGGMFVAPLADRHGRRPVLVAMLVLASLAALGCALSNGFWSLVVFRVLTGLAIGALAPNFIALVGEYAPGRYRAFFVCLVCSLYSAGGIIASLLAIYLIPNFGWRSVFLVGSAAILLAPLMAKALPESPEFLARQGHRRSEFEDVVSRIDPSVDPKTVVPVDHEEAPKAPIAELFRHGNAVNTILIWIVFAMTMLLSYGLNTWLPGLMAVGQAKSDNGLLKLVVLNIGGLLGALLAGYLADRKGIKQVILGYFLVAAIALACLGLQPAGWLVNVLLVLAGATTVGTLAVIHALAVQYYPSLVRSTGVGWAAGIGRIGAISGPILGGALLAMNLTFQQNLLIIAVPGVLGALATVGIRMARGARASRESSDAGLADVDIHGVPRS